MEVVKGFGSKLTMDALSSALRSRTKLTFSHCGMLLYVWVVVVIGITTYPWFTFVTHSHLDKIIWIPFHQHPLLIGDIAGNIVLFVPIGFFFLFSIPEPLKVSSLLRAVFVSVELSILIESSQIFNHTRFPSTTDFLSNVIGGILGMTLGALWFRQKSKGHVENSGFAPPSRFSNN